MSRTALALLATAALTLPAHAADGRWTFSTGTDYTAGDYGEAEDTTIVIVPFTAAYKTDRWSARVTVPYVTIDGPGTVVPGSSGIGGGATSGSSGGGGLGGLLGGLLDGLLGGGSGGASATPSATPTPPTTTTVHESGLGDVSIAFGYVPLKTEGGTKVALGARVRLPTADADRYLGIDDTALAVSTTLSQSFSSRAAIYGAAGYERSFEAEANALFAQIGAEGYVLKSLLIGANIDWAQANDVLRRDSTQAGAYIAFDATTEWSLVLYGSAGLTDTSPDIGAGLRLVFTPD
jgi:hypothetical protein